MLHEKGRHLAPFLSQKFFRREKASDVGVLRLDLSPPKPPVKKIKSLARD